MVTAANEDKEYEIIKAEILELASRDGKLVSPIDLSLEISRPIELGKLKWFNVDDFPAKMKITNTGETVIVSAKWAKQRPYLASGPLDGNYVFSQIHFHWGSDEHEGSEHTVRGIGYPMEMHVVFFKTRYLTQEAALKHDDGLIILVYLIKLQQRTTPGLQWLCAQLPKIVHPQTSTMLPPSPLSSLVVPFSRDYLMYWGCLTTQNCSHTMLWMVSRAALSVSAQDLGVFRQLLNSRKEVMNRNFRGANPHLGRSVFHVNPSKEMKQLLLPGTVDPPGQVLLVNYYQEPSLDPYQAYDIFNRGDASDDKSDKMSADKVNFFRNKVLESCTNCIKSSYGSSVKSKQALSISSIDKLNQLAVKMYKEMDPIKCQKRKHVISRKDFEEERNRELDKRAKIAKIRNPAKGLSAATMKRLGLTVKSVTNKSVLTAKAAQRTEWRMTQPGREGGLCVHLNVKRPEFGREEAGTECKGVMAVIEALPVPVTVMENMSGQSKITGSLKTNKRPKLQSTLAQYFQDNLKEASSSKATSSLNDEESSSPSHQPVNTSQRPSPSSRNSAGLKCISSARTVSRASSPYTADAQSSLSPSALKHFPPTNAPATVKLRKVSPSTLSTKN